MITKDFLFKMSVFTLILGFALISVVIYWLFYPYKVLEFGEGNGVIEQTTVKQGNFIEINQNSCKLKDVTSSVNRQFIDSLVYQVPIVINNRPIGCYIQKEVVYVPRALTPGIYHLVTTISYKVNPIRTIVYTVKTNEFTIVSNNHE